jgi:hypothetical protein
MYNDNIATLEIVTRIKIIFVLLDQTMIRLQLISDRNKILQ